eukprot:1167728-Prorocentrum_lima.AAC.1
MEAAPGQVTRGRHARCGARLAPLETSTNKPSKAAWVLQGWKFKDRCKFKDGMRMLMVATA